MDKRKVRARNVLLALTMASGLLCSGSGRAEGFNASMSITGKAAAEETGLAPYPGAVPLPSRKGNQGDREAANVQFSLGSYGLKVVAVKLKSDDPRERIAEFYRRELARYGAVLDCMGAEPGEVPTREARGGRKSKELTCDGDRAKGNRWVLKAGTRANQRVVSIEPKGDGVHIALVHVEMRGLDDD